MTTGAELADEVADLLEEDYTLNPVWTQAELFDLVTEGQVYVMGKTLAYQIELSGARTPDGTTGATYAFTANNPSRKGVLHVRTNTYEIPQVDVQEVDLLTGVSDPYSAGTPQGYTVQVEPGSGPSGVTTVLRFYPRFSNTSTTINFYTVEIHGLDRTRSSAGTLSIRPIFETPIKFRALHDALMADTEIRNPKAAMLWKGLADILTEALTSLYRGGQLPQCHVFTLS